MSQFIFVGLLPTFRPVEFPPLTRLNILIRLRRCHFPSHTYCNFANKWRSRQHKKQNEFMISTHMVGTWMSEGITKGFSVWIGMTVAKSKTHAVYAIRFFWFNQRREHAGAARQWSAMYLLPVPAGGRKAVGTTGSTVDNIYCSINFCHLHKTTIFH